MKRRSALSEGRGYTGDRQLDELWERINTVVRFLNVCPLASGRLLMEEPGAPLGSGLTFAPGTARSIPHGLGRKARGFFEVAAADVPTSSLVGLYAVAHPPGITSETHVSMMPGAVGICFVWVF